MNKEKDISDDIDDFTRLVKGKYNVIKHFQPACN